MAPSNSHQDATDPRGQKRPALALAFKTPIKQKTGHVRLDFSPATLSPSPQPHSLASGGSFGRRKVPAPPATPSRRSQRVNGQPAGPGNTPTSTTDPFLSRLQSATKPPRATLFPAESSNSRSADLGRVTRSSTKRGGRVRNSGTTTTTTTTTTTPTKSTAAGTGTMSGTAGKWREEQILILCPGSRTTMAQLGCSELTPPAHRIPTRMFADGDLWAPYHKEKRTKTVNGVEEEEWVEDVDSDEGAVYPIEAGRIVNMEALLAFLDHVHGLLTTTYHNTPIMLMASPQWTRPDCETIARYVFENTRTPALCIIHSGIATQYGLKWPNMTVVDIGYQKVDVTAIFDGRVVNHMDVGASLEDRQASGGEVFTQSLLKLLEGKGFNHDMAEQLKKSTICEVLPYAPTAKALVELPAEGSAGTGGGPEAAAAAASAASAAAAAAAAVPVAELPTKPAETAVGDEADASNGNDDEDGVLDVAAIVTSGQTKEFLAKKEKEKGKPGRKAKGDKDEGGAAKPARLPNSKRTHNTFFYEEIVQEEVPPEPKPEEKAETSVPPAAAATAPTAGTEGEKKEGEAGAEAAPAPAPVPAPAPADGAAPAPESTEAPKTEEAAAAPVDAATTAPESVAPTAELAATTIADNSNSSKDEAPERRAKRVRRDIEVGLERFKFAERDHIDRIVHAIYRTVQGIDDMYMRPACWDNVVFVGNGARLRGLRDNILQTLNARHLVSPSTATMFTSELPSNMATPTGTGAQTPTGSFSASNGAPPHQLAAAGGGGVNPLLQAATTAAAAQGGAGGVGTAAVGTPQAGSEAGGPAAVTHHFHSQTPTSIKTATLPTYLTEWTKNGFEEAMFLGAQVAARIAFCLHSNMDAQAVDAQRQMSLSRVDYNELGPKGIRSHSMLG